MIVSELIELLKTCPQDALVLVFQEVGFDTIAAKALIEVTVNPEPRRSWRGAYTDSVNSGDGRIAVLLGTQEDLEGFEDLTAPSVTV